MHWKNKTQPKPSLKVTPSGYLWDNNSHGEVLRVCSHVAQHHDSRQSHIGLALTHVVHHSSNTACIHDQLSQLQHHQHHTCHHHLIKQRENDSCVFIYMNTSWAPHLEMSPKHFTMATTVLLCSCALVTCNSEWVTALHPAHFEYPPMWLQCCLVVTWLVPHEIAAILAQVLCTPFNHAPVYNVPLFEATSEAGMFSCNLLPAHFAEWPGSLTHYCSKKGVEQIPK